MKNVISKLLFLSLLFLSPTFLFSLKLEKVSLQLSWLHQFEYAGYYAAKEKGFYRNVGFDVEFKEMDFEKKDSVIKDVLSGKTTYAIDYSSITKAFLLGEPIVFVANFFKHSPLVLAVQKDIRVPTDLIGKRFMGGNDALENTAILFMLNEFKIKGTDFINVPQTFNLDSFINKQVDATTIFLTNQTYFLDKIGYQYNIINPEKYGSEFYVNNLFTSKRELLNNPFRVRAFRNATIKGWEYALKNKEEIIDLILKKYNTQNKTKDELLYEAHNIEMLMLPKVYPIGSIDSKRVKRMAEKYVQLGLIPKDVDMTFNDFIYDTAKSNLKFSDKELNYLKKKKKLMYCIDPKWMPFEKINEKGQHVGLSSEYFKIFKEKLPVELALFKTNTWVESIDALKEGKCDILSLAITTKSRKKEFIFTSSYLDTPLILVTRNDVTYLEKIEYLKDKKLLMVKGYAHKEKLLEKYPYLNIEEVENIDDGLNAVVSSDAFGFIGALTTAVHKLQNEYVGSLKISANFKEDAKYRIALKKENIELLSIFEKLLNSIDNQTKQHIYSKYVAINYDSRVDYSLVIKVICTSLLIFIFFLYWNVKLNKEKEKTQEALEELKSIKKLLEEKNLKLSKLNITDTLTKIFNRQKIDDELRKEVLRSMRTNSKFSLIMLDIDFFKDVNDTYGHQVGDEFLVEFANIIKNSIREIDTFGRWGGEEFLIICPNTNSSGSIEKAQRIRKMIENHNFNIVGKKTASLGVTSYIDGDNEKTILNRVDTAMYKAKNSGRNKVVSL